MKPATRHLSFWLAIFGTLFLLWAWWDTSDSSKQLEFRASEHTVVVYQTRGIVGVEWLTEYGKKNPLELEANRWEASPIDEGDGWQPGLWRHPLFMMWHRIPENSMRIVEVRVAHWVILGSWIAASALVVTTRVRRFRETLRAPPNLMQNKP